MYPSRRSLRKLDLEHKLRGRPSRRPTAHVRGIRPPDLRRVHAASCALPHRTQLPCRDLNDMHISEAARHVPERLLRSLPCLIQTMRMDVFFLDGNSGEKTVSKRITSGIERDTNFRSHIKLAAGTIVNEPERRIAGNQAEYPLAPAPRTPYSSRKNCQSAASPSLLARPEGWPTIGQLLRRPIRHRSHTRRPGLPPRPAIIPPSLCGVNSRCVVIPGRPDMTR